MTFTQSIPDIRKIKIRITMMVNPAWRRMTITMLSLIPHRAQYHQYISVAELMLVPRLMRSSKWCGYNLGLYQQTSEQGYKRQKVAMQATRMRLEQAPQAAESESQSSKA